VLVTREEERFVLIDGYARVQVLRELGRDLVLSVVLELSEAEALVMAHRLEAKSRRSALEEGWLIRELIEHHGLDQRLVAARLSRSVSWVSRRLGLAQELPEAAQDAVRKGVIPAYAAAKYLVPLARAKREHCELLVAALDGEPISVRELGRIYACWKGADDDEGRLKIVQHPRLALKADAAMQEEPDVPEGDPVAPLLSDLDGIAAIARRAHRRLEGDLLHELDIRRHRMVKRSGTIARLAVQTLTEQLDEERPCSISTPAPRS